MANAPVEAMGSSTSHVEWERKPSTIDANLTNYDETYRTFRWEDAERAFDWSKTGKVNIVHEAIDRHAASHRRTKVALHYTDYERRDEHYTFEDLRAHRFWLDVKSLNTRALALYASEGFVEEGRLRESVRITGLGDEAGYDSLVVMSLLDREYQARVALGLEERAAG